MTHPILRGLSLGVHLGVIFMLMCCVLHDAEMATQLAPELMWLIGATACAIGVWVTEPGPSDWEPN